ncbi:MAG: hypothetical protein ABIM74_09680 [candidate division WOR-3 bacterium]
MRGLLMMLCLVGLAQAQGQFVLVFGGPGNDFAESITRTSDGCFVVAGYSNSYTAGDYDIMVSKFSSSGQHLWTRLFGSDSSDYGVGVIETSNGDIIVVGETRDIALVPSGILAIKLDQNGNLLWCKVIGVSLGYYTSINDVIPTRDGGFALTGVLNSDILLAKCGPNGEGEWFTTHGGAYFDYGNSLIQTKDGGFAVVGKSIGFSVGKEEMMLSIFDSGGNRQWTRTFLMPGSYGNKPYSEGYDLVQYPDGTVLVVGDAWDEGLGGTAFLVAFSQNGSYLWHQCLSPWDIWVPKNLRRMIVPSDSSYLYAWLSQSKVIVKRIYGYRYWTIYPFGIVYFYSFVDDSGSLVAAGSGENMGFGNYDMVLTKFNAAPETCVGSEGYYNYSATRDRMIATPTPSTYRNSFATNPVSLHMGTLVPSIDTVCFVGVNEIECEGIDFFVNGGRIRFSLASAAHVVLSVYDPLGRPVARPVDEVLDAGEYTVNPNLETGLYFVELKIPIKTYTARMLVYGRK